MAGKKVNRLIVPNVYTVNGVEPVTSVNNILPVNGNVTIPIPTVPTNVSAFTNDVGYLTSATLDGYATQSWVQQQGYLTSIPSQYITDSELSTTLASYVTSADLSTTLADYAQTTDIPTVGNGTITINQGGVQKGTFTVNQGSNTTINLDAGGGTVDQTFDGTSANAQSGIAIAGAGFLQNTATGTNSLNILGNSSSISGNDSICIGKNAWAEGTSSVSIGNSSSAGKWHTIALGYKAKVSSNYSIQIGYGTNNISSTLSVGFSTNSGNFNWQLLNGKTGLIPDDRLSSNIARISQIPDVSNFVTNSSLATTLNDYALLTDIPTIPTNISSFTNDSGYITGISSLDVVAALGYTPYNSSNPNGYTSNTGTVISVNNSQPDASGNVTLSIPTVPTNISAFTNDTGYQTSSDVNTIVTNAISTLLGNIYPVGSIYIGTQATCPLETLISGSTWELVAADRVLQGSSTNHAANTTIAAGLPNITGTASGSRDANSTKTGAFSSSSFATSSYVGHPAASGYQYYLYKFDASDSNTIYRDDVTTVQPPAYVVNVWRRTA